MNISKTGMILYAFTFRFVVLLALLNQTFQIEEESFIENEVHNPPIYFKQPPHNEYLCNQNQRYILIDCSVQSLQGLDTVDVEWFRNKAPVLNNSIDLEFKREILSNGSLKLNLISEFSNLFKVHEPEISQFRCKASDSFGSIISNPVKVYKVSTADSGRILRYFKQPVNRTLSQGDRLLLKCKPVLSLTKLRGKIRHKWYKNDIQIKSFGANKNLYEDGTLEINPVSESDSGTYKCIARYRAYSFESRKASINVIRIRPIISSQKQLISQIQKPAKFISWPEDISVPKNEEVVFECQVLDEEISGSLAIGRYAYTWLKNGSPLDFNSFKRFQLVQGNNLKIIRVKEKDSGSYTCRVCSYNKENCNERSGTLKVLVSPHFLKRPSNVNATLKSNVEFECNAYGIPRPKIQWFKNGEPIYPSNYFVFDSKKGNLKILGIIAQDEGYYQCLASNDLGTIQSVSQLVVQSSDNEKSSISKKSTNTRMPTSTALVVPTKPKTIVHLSAPTSLKSIHALPRSLEISWNSPSIIKQSGGSTDNSIIYTVIWRAKHMENQRELITTNSSLLIDELKPDTLYLIQVCASLSSTKGPYAFIEVNTTSELKIPGAPIDFKAEFVDFKYHQIMSPTLKFRWKRPIVNAENIIKYRLYYEHLHYGPDGLNESRENDYDLMSNINYYNPDQYFINEYEEEEEDEKYLDIDTPSGIFQNGVDSSYEFLLEDLKKYSTYKFRLVAISNEMENNHDFKSNEGAQLIIETPSDVPDGPPKNLKTETLNTTAIFVRWDLPDIEKRNGLIIGYKLSIKENEKKVWNSNEQAEPRSKLINNLLPNHKYSIRITARTQNGSGPSSDWVIAETFAYEMDETKVPGQPLELIADPTDKSIVIHWVPPADSNVTLVRKYLLSYGVNFPTNMVEIPGNHNSYIIKNLEPSSTYILSLKAKNNAGLGKEILKDVITKRKSALGENENLFPPLNVQAVAISPQSIEVRWTDWHLKQDESIPDDRYYTVQYSTNEMSSDEYLFKNSTERNVIISNLNANTLYDFAVRLVIGSRKSDWSMTSSQMTMESSPAPRDIRIKSDPDNPSNVIINWKAPNYSLISGYVISFLDVDTYSRLKESSKSDIKWKHNYITATEEQTKIKAIVRKLKRNTVYYFKIQVRNKGAYGGSSPTIIYKTPNNKGVGGGVIFKPDQLSKSSNSQLEKDDVISSVHPSSSNSLQKSFFLLIAAVVCSLIILIVIILITFCCKRKNYKNKQQKYTEAATMKRNYNIDENIANHAHQQQLLLNSLNNTNNYPPEMMSQPTQGNNHINFSINSSTTSTLLKQLRTPNHHGNPLNINNPNHMMLMMNPLSINNNAANSINGPQSNNNTHLSNANTSHNDVEFYSNMTNHQTNPDSSDACFQYNSIYNNKQQFPNNVRTSSINDDNFSQQDDLNKDLTSASEALAAANAAFNAPIVNHNMHNMNNMHANDNIFMRNTSRPKPIAMPISTTSPNSMNHVNPSEQQNVFGSVNTRKSFKNLPMATATLIQSNQSAGTNVQNNANHPLSFNFNDVTSKQSQKIHYTARPYIIDNQVQSNGDYSTHSPVSSCHSSSQQSQVYDKVGNPINAAISTKSLLQPLKSFGNSNQNSNQIASVQPSSFSIPNTPAKYCESPAKKQLLVSLANQQSCTSTTIAKGNHNKSSEVLMMMGKSTENLHDKKLSACNKNDELTSEMADLEGIMKDLNAITAQQFEC